MGIAADICGLRLRRVGCVRLSFFDVIYGWRIGRYMCFKIVCRAFTMPCVEFKRQKGKIIIPEQNNAVERKYERSAAMSLPNIHNRGNYAK